MELEEMKQMWQQYDKVLQENKMLNEQLMNHMLKDRSNDVIKKLVNMEYLGIAVCSIILVYLVLGMPASGASLLLGISYLLCLILLIVSLVFCFYKIKYLGKINLSLNTVTSTAEQMQRYHLMINWERTVSVILFPVVMIAFFAVVMYQAFDVDIFDDIMAYMFRITIGLVAGIAAMLVLYRVLYFQNIKKIQQNLEEIEQFKKG